MDFKRTPSEDRRRHIYSTRIVCEKEISGASMIVKEKE